MAETSVQQSDEAIAGTEGRVPGTEDVLVNAMSVDVEDYFQVSAMEPVIRRVEWESYPSRVERNTQRVMDLFDANEVKATFFTLGWVAERFPALIREIVDRGHELASHGMDHTRVSAQSSEAFRMDIQQTKKLLEDVSGVRVLGYRAASFSLTRKTEWAHIVMAEEGYTYSSSIYPIKHDHYGLPDAPRSAYQPIANSTFLEIPICTATFGKRRIPCGGGGYFRLLPYSLSRSLIRRVNQRDNLPCTFYFHPWEIDPEQPRIAGISVKTRFRHYTNLRHMENRLDRILKALQWDRMDHVYGLRKAG